MTALYIQTPTPPHPCNKQCLLSVFIFPVVIIFLYLHKGAALSVGIPADEGPEYRMPAWTALAANYSEVPLMPLVFSTKEHCVI